MTAPGYGHGTTYGRLEFSRLFLFVACVLFVLAAFAAGGSSLGNIPAWSWAFGGFASWMLAGVL